MTLKNTFQINFERIMKQRGMTGYQLAKEIGVPRTSVYRWISGESLPVAESYEKLCQFLNIPFDALYKNPN